ncbi:MAG: hypothetical protein R3E39_32190 [Anaerolineae bacterium]
MLLEQTKRFWIQRLFYLSVFVSSTGAALLSFGTKGLLENNDVRILIGIVTVISCAVNAAMGWLIFKYDEHGIKEMARKEGVRTVLKTVIETGFVTSSSATKIRGAVFLFDEGSSELYIYACHGYPDYWKRLRFGEHQGCIGNHFWQRYGVRTRGYDLSYENDKTLKSVWRLDKGQVNLLKGVRSVRTVMLWDTKKVRAIGMLSFDSDDPYPVSKLKEREVANKALEVAGQVLEFLTS